MQAEAGLQLASCCAGSPPPEKVMSLVLGCTVAAVPTRASSSATRCCKGWMAQGTGSAGEAASGPGAAHSPCPQDSHPVPCGPAACKAVLSAQRSEAASFAASLQRRTCRRCTYCTTSSKKLAVLARSVCGTSCRRASRRSLMRRRRRASACRGAGAGCSMVHQPRDSTRQERCADGPRTRAAGSSVHCLPAGASGCRSWLAVRPRRCGPHHVWRGLSCARARGRQRRRRRRRQALPRWLGLPHPALGCSTAAAARGAAGLAPPPQLATCLATAAACLAARTRPRECSAADEP